MDSEKQPILVKADIQEVVSVKVEKHGHFKWIYLVIFPICFTFYIGEGMFTLVTDEWTQQKVKKEFFPNTSVHSNFSVCDIVNKSTPDYVHYKSVQKKSAEWLMYFKMATYAPGFVTSLVFPAYSDSYGRRNIIIISMLGYCVKILGITAVLLADQKLYYILICNAFHGLLGGASTFIATFFSYVADVTHGEKERAQGIVLLDFSLILTGLVSSPLSGVLIQTLGLGFAYTGVICSGLATFAFVMACLFLPETLEKSKRLPAKSVLATLKQTVSFYTSSDFKGKRLCYIILLLAFFFNDLCESNRTPMEIVYFLGQPFCWGPAFIGYFELARKACLTVFGLIALKVLQKCMSNVSIASLSCVSMIASYIIEAFARTDITIYCVAVVGMLGFLVIPMLRGLLSNLTSPDMQGSLFASIAAIQILGVLVATPENEIYAATLSIMDGFVFLIMAMFSVCAFVCLLLYCFIQPPKTISITPIYTNTKTAVDKV